MHNFSLRLLFVVTLALGLFASGCGTSGNPRVLIQTELGDITTTRVFSSRPSWGT